MAELEARLGVRLLHRTTRKLSLTAVGEQFHRHCVAMREDALAAEDAVAQARNAARHHPRGLRGDAGANHAGAHPAALSGALPLVNVDMRVSNRAVDLVEEGLDVALRVRPTLDDSGSLVVKNFGPTHTLLVASPALLARQGRPSYASRPAKLDTVAMNAAAGRCTWLLDGPDGPDGGSFTLQHTPRYLADDLLTLKFAVLGGTGMACLPDYLCANELRAGQLELVLPGWSAQAGNLPCGVSVPTGLIPAVRAFLDFLDSALAQAALPRRLTRGMP